MLKNAYLLAKIGADTAQHEQHFAEILPRFCRSAVVSPTDAATGAGLREGGEDARAHREGPRPLGGEQALGAPRGSPAPVPGLEIRCASNR